MFRILHLDIRTTRQAYEQKLTGILNSNGNNNMTMTIKEIATRQGKTVYRTDVTNPDDGSVFSIITEKDGANGDVVLKPLSFTNMSSGYYENRLNTSSSEDTDEDPGYLYSMFLAAICADLGIKGTCAYTVQGNVIIYKDGNRKNGRLAAVDEAGNLYGAADAKKLSAGGGDEFVINKPLNEWLSDADQLVLQAKLQAVTDPGDKADLIGKYLLFKKGRNEIDFDEFYDIFRQPGMLIGYKDPQLKQIYQLLM